MSFSIVQKLGDVEFRANGNDIQEAFEAFGFLADLPGECPICGCLVSPYHRVTPNTRDDYYGLKCRPGKGEDTHECTFGQYKEKGLGFFYKDNWKASWKPEANDERGRGRDDDRRDERRDDRRNDDRRPARNNQPVRRGGEEFAE